MKIFNKLKLLLPFVISPIIRIFYSYFDGKYIVKIIGCGCDAGFNANDLNLIIIVIIFIISIIYLNKNSLNIENQIVRKYYIVLGIIILFVMHFILYSFFLWK